MSDVKHLIDDIKNHPTFVELQSVVENSEGWHENEDVYSHSTKTLRHATEFANGVFIENDEARARFLDFMNGEKYGFKYLEIAQIAALLHDCGKTIKYKEGDVVDNIKSQSPDNSKNTMFAGHEYFGGKVVAKKILDDLGLNQDLIRYICKIVKHHGDLNNSSYFEPKSNWSTDQIISHVKSQAGGLYLEELFNAYCDCYDAPAFENSKEIIERLFNSPDLYTKREYYI